MTRICTLCRGELGTNRLCSECDSPPPPPEDTLSTRLSRIDARKFTGERGTDFGAFANEVLATAASHQSERAAEVAEYERLLRAHDWSFEFSDDPSVYRRGREARKTLEAMRFRLDLDFRIWNEHAPVDYRITPRERAQA